MEMNAPVYMADMAPDDRFVIDDDGKADWAIRQIIEARAERDRLVAHFKNQIDKAMDNCSRIEEHFRAMLLPYMDMVPAHRTKTQTSYELPSGTLKIKAPGPKYTVNDDQLVDWLKQNGYAEMVKIKTTESPAWGDFKKLTEVNGDIITLKKTGEIIDGVTVQYREPKFEVEVTV